MSPNPNTPSVSGIPQGKAPHIHQIVDAQYGLTAAAFTIPTGWQAQSSLQWDTRQYAAPFRLFARTFDPQTGSVVEFFPAATFCWIEPYMGFGQQGHDAGGGAVLLKPISAADTLTRWVIPLYRPKSLGVGVTGIHPLPQMAQYLNYTPPQGAAVECVCVQIEYQENGRLIEEEFYGLKLLYSGIPSYGAAGTLMQYNWGFDRLFSFRAPKGQLDAAQHEKMWSLVRSLRINPAWQQLCGQIQQQINQLFNQHLQAGYDSINAATRMSQQISAQNDQFLQHQQQRRDSEYASDQHRRQQNAQTNDYTQNDAFGDYLMGRETYNDPYHQYGSQHGYHEYVWTDSQGNYQYSDTANFDPNIGATTRWTLMQKKTVNGG